MSLAPSKDMAIGVAGIAATVLIVLWIFKKQATDAGNAIVDFVAGVATGKNELTKDTPYYGAGLLGTLGAGVNVSSGGVLQNVGETLGAWAWDITHKSPAP